MRAIVSVLSERMLALLREASMNPNKIPETPAARKTRLFLEAQGRKRGRIEGEVKGKQDALLALLKARGLSVSTEQRRILRGCTDPAKLDRWIVEAAFASSVDDVLGTKGRTTPARTLRPRRPERRTPTARRT